MKWTQEMISDWADSTFGTGYDALTIAIRANEEMAELLTELCARRNGSGAALDECADIAIMLLRLAHMCGGDLQKAINSKMAVNSRRDWTTRGDGTGFHQ
jgi:NTP pyrophosphatase (non-canonical NTP hydrolase)